MRLAELEALTFVGLGSGVAAKLDSVVVGGVAISALGALGTGAGEGTGAGATLFISEVGLFGFSDRASCDEMIAGSTGAPLTVD